MMSTTSAKVMVGNGLMMVLSLIRQKQNTMFYGLKKLPSGLSLPTRSFVAESPGLRASVGPLRSFHSTIPSHQVSVYRDTLPFSIGPRSNRQPLRRCADFSAIRPCCDRAAQDLEL